MNKEFYCIEKWDLNLLVVFECRERFVVMMFGACVCMEQKYNRN